MNCSKVLNRKVKNVLWLMFCGFCFGITPYIFQLADLERGYNATGGEIFVPLIPFLVYALKDTIKEFKYERNECND